MAIQPERVLSLILFFSKLNLNRKSLQINVQSVKIAKTTSNRNYPSKTHPERCYTLFMDSLARFLDFADHSAAAKPEDIKKLCKDVATYGLHAVFVNPCYVTFAKETLINLTQPGAANIPVGTVISFPLGGDTKALKMAAANNAVSQGANELDVVPNIGLYLAGNIDQFMTELTDVVESAHMTGSKVIVKFILDPGHFDNEKNPKESLKRAAEIVRAAGADFVKLGSGMGPRNPTIEDLKAVKEAIGDTIKIKIAGGVTDRKTAEAFLAAGANRIGTSHAIQIVTGTTSKSKSQKSEE